MATLSRARKAGLPLPQLPGAPEPPPFRLLVGYFAFVQLCLLVGSIGLVTIGPALGRGDFLSPPVLATVHLFTLGIIVTAVFGVLHQFYPMALGYAARSRRVAYLGLATLVTGSAAVTIGFAVWTPALLALGWLLLFASVGCVSWNLLPARRRVAQARFVGGFVSAGHVALGLAMLVAAGRIGTYFGWWTLDRLGSIAAHFHLAALGFGTLTAIGVGSRMLPMFLVSRESPRRGIVAAATLVGVGLVAFAIGAPFRSPAPTWLGASMMATGVVLYLASARRYFRLRLRPSLDPAMRAVAVAFVNLGITAAIGAFLLVLPGFRPGLWIAYGVMGVLGWLVLLITGILQKLVPHLSWMRLFGRHGAGRPIPDVQSLIHDATARVALVLAEAGVLGLAGGALAGSPLVVRLGSLAWLAGVLVTSAQFLRIPLMARGWLPLPVYRKTGDAP